VFFGTYFLTDYYFNFKITNNKFDRKVIKLKINKTRKGRNEENKLKVKSDKSKLKKIIKSEA